jgi:hypothetical protein
MELLFCIVLIIVLVVPCKKLGNLSFYNQTSYIRRPESGNIEMITNESIV